MQQVSPTSRHRFLNAGLVAPIALAILFLWVYARAIPELRFVMDDFIHTRREIGATLYSAVVGEISWSGYRPLAVIMRILLDRIFGLERMAGYYVAILTLHFANTLLLYFLVLRVTRIWIWAFVAGAVMLLIPSHNEAVLWYAANSNLLAALFALLSLHFVLSFCQRGGPWNAVVAALLYFLAVLSYEVVISLPILILLACLILDRRTSQLTRRWPIFALLGVAALAALGLRLAVADLMPERADYHISLALATLLRGYGSLWQQIVLLGTSPPMGATGYYSDRAWMVWTRPEALTAIILGGTSTVLVLRMSMRQDDRLPTLPVRGFRLREILAWIGWGIAWVLLVGLPFASLSGRNPENRYTYLLGIGFAVTIAALGALLWSIAGSRRWAKFLVVAAFSALIAFYAFTSTSDAAEWAAAGEHTRQVEGRIAQATGGMIPDGQSAFVLGVPWKIGAAYVYTIQEAFEAALDLDFGWREARGFLGEQRMMERLGDATNKARYFGFFYSQEDSRLYPIERARICEMEGDCVEGSLVQAMESYDEPRVAVVTLSDQRFPEFAGTFWIGLADEEATWGCYSLGREDDTIRLYGNAFPSLDERCAAARALAYR